MLSKINAYSKIEHENIMKMACHLAADSVAEELEFTVELT